MVRTQVQLTARQHEQLKRVARAKRLSLSEVVRRLVDRALVHELHPEQLTGIGALIASCGAFRETRTASAAKEHDQHLAESYL